MPRSLSAFSSRHVPADLRLNCNPEITLPMPLHTAPSLPDIPRLKRLMQSLAMLDAILSPEWDYRYYSFNAHWFDGEQMGSMRNGSGDELFALFSDAGCYIKGLDHEQRDPGVPPEAFYCQLPEPFATQAMEVAFSPQYLSFALWRGAADTAWHRASVEACPPDRDGSEWMLDLLLDPRPDAYVAFAADYYEVDLPPAPVEALYAHEPLTEALATALNPDADWATLQEDAQETGYPLAT
jgi:hypothetical protein